ncbi:aldo-keto reductase family 1 member C3-like [Dendropsophus ebraccatus]|uniref:aldo-keto reductase family 1 member C3-like n=1 Tax=Dendropsophus ebraccatus TaxID=150705 RepID=UPI00383134E9
MTPDAYVRLTDGHTMPVVGFGTYAPVEVPKSEAEKSVTLALEVGYRHFDGASFYANEVEVGRAIRAKIADGTVKREDVFYSSKLWLSDQSPERVRPSLEKSLRNLQLDYVDLFLIHNPMELKPGEDRFPTDENGKVVYHNTDIRDIWKAMEECKESGLAKSIGVSSFNRRQLELILNMEGLKHKPVCNQVECHIYLNQSKLLGFCKSHDITLVAFSVLGSSRDAGWIDPNSPYVLEDPVLIGVAKKNGRTPAQVAMRHLLQRGIVVLAKSFNPERIKENFKVFDFQLSDEDMEALNQLDRNMRYVNERKWPDHPKCPFHDEY